MKITKRTKAILAAVLLFSGLYFLPQFWEFFVGIQVFLVYWFLDKDVKLNEIFALFYIPILYATISFYLLGLINEPFWSISASIVGAMGYYLLLLAVNIINVSMVRTVPLKKAAFSTLYFIGMVLFFFLGMFIVTRGWGINPQVLFFCLSLVGFALSYLRLITNRYPWLEVAIYAFVVGQIAVLINFWPSHVWLSVAAVVGWSFIYLGLLQHTLDKSLNKSIIREYIAFGLLLFIILILV